MIFKVIRRSPLEQDGLHRVTVAEVENQSYRERDYVLAQGEKATVVTPLESFGDSSGCLSVNGDSSNLSWFSIDRN